ncbi:MAG: T9SS type A sorting domain-containing protein [Chitinophagales bacterium]|nr:T9SS type A sorting domain-containing protein [Bacteroidota bacterium]MCB9043757.1 T9SS type A sorting domain-containing protein [Chitinophagales bacterium]
MRRKDFLKGASLASLGLVLPTSSFAQNSKTATGDACVLIPSETAGPFPLDLTENNTFFRQDVREDRTGVQLNVKIKVLGLDNCEPMQNVRVNIWHCDKDGVYSGYNSNNNPGSTTSTYLRGYQFSDANGEVEFITILPGWYNGRIAHIHFQVHVSSAYSAISQFTFDIATKNAIYAANSSLYTKGADPMTFASDNIFSDGVQYQLTSLTENADTGGWDATIEVSVQGSGTTTGLGHIEKEIGKVFSLGQNFPNPYQSQTSIPFTLKQNAEVKLELWDLSGKKVAVVLDESKMTGDYIIDINPKKLGLANGSYIYQLEAKNRNGVFRLPKMMTYIA